MKRISFNATTISVSPVNGCAMARKTVRQGKMREIASEQVTLSDLGVFRAEVYHFYTTNIIQLSNYFPKHSPSNS